MHILLAQLNPTVGDVEGNAVKIIQAFDHARHHKADLVLFSEMCLSGYPPEDFLLLDHFMVKIQDALQKIIEACVDLTAIVGVPRVNPELNAKPLLNSAAVIQDGRLLGYQDKILLPTYDVFDERRYFEPGGKPKTWNLHGKKVAITICEDIWKHGEGSSATYQRDPLKELAAERPDVLLNLSASPFSQLKFEYRKKVCQYAATTLGCPVLLCNQVGGNDSLIFDGYSLFVGQDGTLIDYAKGFQEDSLMVDLSQMEPLNAHIPDHLEDLYQALVLGIRDYFHKSKFSKACLGLSGGIDSALVACLAVEALGPENVLGVMMPSRYSSPGSLEDAKKLADHLQIETKEIPIEPPFREYMSLLSPHFQEKTFDATEENLQARIRGMILMALSNKLGYIVLSTGNKSELAMGYSTLYGDMCGGLGAISDLTKQQVYALSKWINRRGEVIPWNTIDKPPSAELRPNQKDTDTLPDYEIVDNVLQAYIEEHLTPQQIRERFSYPEELVEDLVIRIHRNEYKRRQAPPGLRISEKAFSVGRRFPIVQKFV